MPIAGVASEPGDLEPEDQSDMPQSDFGNQTLEAQPVNGRSAGMAEILINDDNAFIRPAKSPRSLTQGILTGGTFCILEHLLQSTLTHIQTRVTAEVMSGDVMSHISDPPEAVSGHR